MKSIVIIEDDPYSAELLSSEIQKLNLVINVVAVLSSVSEATQFFKTNHQVDLVFSDIQLSDGLSFSIFREVEIHCPVIFVSVYDQYVMDSFNYGGIDYILKPASADSILKSIEKYQGLEQHFYLRNSLFKNIINNYQVNARTRILGKHGKSFVSLLLSDIVLFTSRNHIVYAIDSGGSKFIIDKTLNALESELDNRDFFRINRQYIVNIKFVKGYTSYERVKILVQLNQHNNHVLIVGQEKAKAFRSWIC